MDTAPAVNTQPGPKLWGVQKDFNMRQQLENLRGQLNIERSSFMQHWLDIDLHLAPRRSRIYITDVDRGWRRNQLIINSTATHAWGTLRSGMMSGFTSPSRPWFRLSTQDADLAKFESVKEWLYDCTTRVQNAFLKSNVYNILPTVYGDMSGFATGCTMVMEDFDNVIHCFEFPLGSYYLFNNDKLRVNGFMRDFRLSVRQVVEKFVYDTDKNDFDWARCSSMVKNLWDAGTTETWVDLVQYVGPNAQYKPGSLKSQDKKYISVYYERGTQTGSYSASVADSTKTLSVRGYDRFRVLAPRWEVSGEDVYGTMCPGMESLGDNRSLQTYERRAAQALEKSINPPMVGPSSLRSSKATMLPGDITFLDGFNGQKFEPAYMLNPNFQQYNTAVQAIEKRISKTFHEDLWLVISNLDHGNVTAEQVRALQNEKLQEIGPVVDRLNQDLLDPLVEITFEIMQKQGLLPPPPPEMAKQPMKIEYTSIIAQAQKALSAGGIEQFTGYVLKVREAHPEDPNILDKVNFDEAIERYGDDLTIAPGIVRDDDTVAKLRQAKAQAQAKQQQMAAAEQASKTAKNLAQAPTDGANALSDLISQGKAGSLVPS